MPPLNDIGEIMINSKTMVTNEKNSVVFLTFPKLNAKPGQCHAFSTRFGGVSKGSCASMNFSFLLDDNDAAVRENFARFCTAFGADAEKAVLTQQTHTANVRIVTKEDAGKGLLKERDYTDVDGLITNEPGITLVTQYADCTPLVFFDPEKKVVATSHAGWRGTVSLIGAKTVELMCENFGCDPKDIIAGIGPSIGGCCYEVDDPVINEIRKLDFLDFGACYTDKGNGKYMLDLKEVNREILVHSGLLPENIDTSDLCTCCNSHVFHSHRATGGKRGTLAMMIALK